MDSDAGIPPEFALLEDDLLHFDNLHVDVGPELPDEITDIQWLAADGFEVSVQLPLDLPADLLADLPSFPDGGAAGGDWLI